MGLKKGHPTTTGRIDSVVIRWCGKNGKLQEMEVDLTKAKGFLWQYDPDTPIDDLPPVQDKRNIPTGKPIKVIGSCTPPAPVQANSEGPSCCWWDGTKWVCPDEPAP